MVRWDPKAYGRHSSMQQAWARELIARLDFQGHEQVLDLGCGNGMVTCEIARALPRGRVVGIDSSPEMIAFARRENAEVANARFEVRDARQLDFHGEFDTVFSNAALHWVRDHGPVLRGIRESLKPGGRFYLSMGGRGNAADMIQVMEEELFRREPWRTAFAGFPFPWYFYGAEEYRGWVLDAGLTPLRVELKPKDMTHPDAESLAGWVATTWLPYLERLDEAERSAFIRESAAAYVARHPADDRGLIHLRMVRLEAEGGKS